VNSYQAKQLELTKKIEEDFKDGLFPSTIVDSVSDYINDNRRCLTTVVFIPQHLEKIILDKIINPLKKIDPTQCYYIPNSFHVTIRNIRIAEYPPSFDDFDIEKAKKVFRKVIPKYHSFIFDIKRLFELPTSLAISAFSDKTLGDLALELREKLRMAGVSDNKIYADENIVIGNTTISRFTDTPNSDFKEKVKEFKNICIGSFEVRKISLITTNAICHPSKTKIIEEYLLT